MQEASAAIAGSLPHSSGPQLRPEGCQAAGWGILLLRAYAPRAPGPQPRTARSLRAIVPHRAPLTPNTSTEFSLSPPRPFALGARRRPRGQRGRQPGLAAGSCPSREGIPRTDADKLLWAAGAEPPLPPAPPHRPGTAGPRPPPAPPEQPRPPGSQLGIVPSGATGSPGAGRWCQPGADCGKAAPTPASPRRRALAHRRQRSAGAEGGREGRAARGCRSRSSRLTGTSRRSSSWICTASPEGCHRPGGSPPSPAPLAGGERCLRRAAARSCPYPLARPSVPVLAPSSRAPPSFLSQPLPAPSCLSERCSWKWAL